MGLRTLVVALTVAMVMTVGCSGRGLDRSRAARAVAALDHFKAPAYFSLQTDGPFFQGSFTLTCRSQAELEHHPVNSFLMKQGWIRYESRSTPVGFRQQANCPVMILTDAGKTASAEWQSRRGIPEKSTVWTVPIGQRELVEVTGLTDAPDGSKLVEFHWKWSPNRLGHALQEVVAQAGTFFQQSRQGSADCRLWDDGWRCTLMQMGNSFEDLGEFSLQY